MKHTLRQQIKEIIKNIPEHKKQEYSFSITQKIIKKFGHLQNRHIYTSMQDEVDTKALITQLQKLGKKIFNCETSPANLPTIDIFIVPGRAFTKDNKRLGRGGGHYDKLLSQYPKTTKIGICFPQQILQDIPTDSHDIPMDEVIYSTA